MTNHHSLLPKIVVILRIRVKIIIGRRQGNRVKEVRDKRLKC